MTKEQNLRNIGISLAMTSYAIVSCGPEQTSAVADFDVKVLEPGQCSEVINGNIRVCNTTINNNRVGIISRKENGEWRELDGIDLGKNERFEFDGLFEGISMFRDGYNNIHVRVDEPLLSATPVPTKAPTPKPPQSDFYTA